jgi:hypothetical protein
MTLDFHKPSDSQSMSPWPLHCQNLVGQALIAPPASGPAAAGSAVAVSSITEVTGTESGSADAESDTPPIISDSAAVVTTVTPGPEPAAAAVTVTAFNLTFTPPETGPPPFIPHSLGRSPQAAASDRLSESASDAIGRRRDTTTMTSIQPDSVNEGLPEGLVCRSPFVLIEVPPRQPELGQAQRAWRRCRGRRQENVTLKKADGIAGAIIEPPGPANSVNSQSQAKSDSVS